MIFDVNSQCFVCGHKIVTCYRGSYNGFEYSCCIQCSDMIMFKVHSIHGCQFMDYSFDRKQKIVFEYAFKLQRFNLGRYKAIKQSEEILNC